MSTVRTVERRQTPRTSPATRSESTVRVHRAREMGVGYGSSSGYGSSRHYADTRGQAYFRCR